MWLVFPLLLFDQPPDMFVDFESNRSRCPESMRAIEAVGRVRTASFSWLDPGSHILPHTDAYYHRLIRAHLGLRVPPQSLLRVEEEIRELREGEAVVLDGQTPHEAANLSPVPRVTLLVDVEMTEAEEAFVMGESSYRREALQAYVQASA